MAFKALPLTVVPGGLFTVAHVDRTNAHYPQWANGMFSWDTHACPTSLVLTDVCAGGEHGPIADGASGGQEGYPFGIIAEYTCATVGYSLAYRREAAKEQLKAGTQKGVERELQKGEAVIAGGHFDAHYLADADAVDLSGAGSVSIGQGVAALEQGLADCGLGTQGVIHLSTSAGSLAASEKIIERKGNEFFTRLGTPVVVGVGYDPAATKAASAPTTAVKPAKVGPKPVPATQLIYATGPVAVRLGPIEILDDIVDIKKNLVTTTAARPAAVYTDNCCHFVVKVKSYDGTVVGLP